MSLPNTIQLVIGDWSGDGHGRTETIAIRSNLTVVEVEAAYTAGAELIGVDLVESVARDYEDSTLSASDWEKYVAAGFPADGIDASDDGFPTDEISLWHDSFTALYLFTVAKGNSAFEFEAVEQGNTINIGGYGLFY